MKHFCSKCGGTTFRVHEYVSDEVTEPCRGRGLPSIKNRKCSTCGKIISEEAYQAARQQRGMEFPA